MKIYKVEDYKRPFYIQDFNYEKHLFIAFSSYGQNYEWFKTIKKFENIKSFNKLWIRDLASAYWHGEYPGLGIGPFILRDFIKQKIKESKAEKVITLGFSMGGYGAIMFGCLCNVDLVMVFSSQTWIPEARRKRYNLYKKWEGLQINEEYTDLKNIFIKYNENNKTEYNLFYGKNAGSDRKFAYHLQEEKGVILNPVETGKHNSVKIAFSTGIPRKIITNFLQ